MTGRLSLLSRALLLGVMLSGGMLGGCTARPDRVDPRTAADAEIAEIAISFERTVERLTSAEDATWHAGWSGNVFVNAFGGADSEHIGLCHQWRDAVYRGVLFDVRRVGWVCSGIAINRGTRHEHHAVLVARPDLEPGELLPEAPETGAYVLEAWSRGRADIYRLKDWITLPFFREVEPELVDVARELRDRDRARGVPAPGDG